MQRREIFSTEEPRREAAEHLSFPNLWELSIEEAENLQRHIEKYKGAIRLFVHPFYESAEHYPRASHEAELLNRIDRAIKQMAEIDSDKTPAVFLMEPYQKAAELPKHFDKKRINNKFFVIPTQPASPQPFFEGDKKGLDADIHWSKNWSVFSDWLKELGVKKILIGGQYLIMGTRVSHQSQKTPQKENLELRGCVGAASRMLARDFEVEFSNFAFPKTRKEVKEAGLTAQC